MLHCGASRNATTHPAHQNPIRWHQRRLAAHNVSPYRCTEMNDLDSMIDAAHAEAERIESEALQLEARIIRAGGVPPRRPFGRPVSAEAVAQNLTLKSLLQRRDPALAAFFGIGSDLQRKAEEERVAREMQAEAMRLQTERLSAQNQAAAANRYRQQLAPLPQGWRRG